VKRIAILAFARYRPWGLLIVLAFASHVSIAQCAFADKKSKRSISYSFEPLFSNDKMSLRVMLEFKGGRSGEAELEVPSSYAGQQHTRFRPILEQEHFQLLSDTALIKPKLDSASTQDVYFDWQKLPVSWSLASSFGVDDRCQSFHGAWKDFETALSRPVELHRR
jgi:hypothetical protein